MASLSKKVERFFLTLKEKGIDIGTIQEITGLTKGDIEEIKEKDD